MAVVMEPDREAVCALITEVGLDIHEVLQWPVLSRRGGAMRLDYRLRLEKGGGSIEVSPDQAARFLDAMRRR